MLSVSVQAGVAFAWPEIFVVPVLAGHIPAWATQAARVDDFRAKPGTFCEVFRGSSRVLLAGVGDGSDLLAWEQAGALAAARLARVPHIAIDARGVSADQAAALASGAVLRAWRYEKWKTRAEDDAPRLASLDLFTDDPASGEAWCRTSAWIAGTAFARNLVAEPSNILTPQEFTARLKDLETYGVSLEILDEPALAAQGFGCLLAVGQGSVHRPCLAVLRWPGTAGGKQVAFVGKGITFDTGGISIKPADGMWAMRADMAGAAACAGAMLSLALRHSPAPAIAVLALAENATGAGSYRPGDILHSLSGLTVEVVDTDAEGRLVLADALAWTLRQDVAAIVDLATLTGSIVTALGHEMAGMFAGKGADGLAEGLAEAGEAVGQRVWPMPVDDSHSRALESTVADIRQCVDGRMQPDASQAAAFLRAVVEHQTDDGAPVSWVHLDIAGVESREKADDFHAQGATGFGVRLLDRLVADRFEGGIRG